MASPRAWAAGMKARAFRLMASPDAQWQALGTACPPAAVVLRTHAIPLSLAPALGWGIGTYFFSVTAPGDPASAIRLGAGTFLLCLISIALYALAFNLVLPLYGGVRDWRRAYAVAAYASTPVLVSGVLLVLPALIVTGVIALIYALYLAHVGVQRLLGVARSDAAEFVAIASVLFAIGSSLLGALFGWLRLM